MSTPPGKTVWTEADFDQLSWHDNSIYGLALRTENWKSDLLLDIDYITEWLCGVDQRVRFLIAPATLTFHNVTDLRLDVDWGDSHFQVALIEPSIHAITRERVAHQLIHLDRPYYEWTIQLNLPKPGGFIRFGATGFTQ